MTEKINPGNAGGHSALLKQALRAVEQMKQKLNAADPRQHQPIAIIGMGCRFPGEVYDAASFWELLKHGREALSPVPADRWNIDEYYDPDPSKPGKMVSRVGGFLTGVDFFDAGFFGIAPREAAMMDPQQRLLLEVVWEALENAGIAPRSLRGSRAGMYLGIASGDYAQMQLHAGDAGLLDVHFASGNAHSVASGRLSYLLGLKGPSLSVDTACSSSLVAVHLACQALRSRECTMAIAGGVNVILAPETTVALSQAQMMSPDGRCRTFDDRANGFVRAEGCGVVVLKPLDKAQADGDPILAVIRGNALNQDGASSSLTVPNGPSQEDLMRRALKEAELTAAQVGYVEAHGTGTSLGDPIELRALGSVYGASRKAGEPVLVGSLKTNFGHMEAAAGVGGLIKLVLALQHGEVPAHLHFETPTSHVPWDEIRLAVPRSTMPWPGLRNADGELTPRVGAVSSFGFSGTNAHLVVEQAPAAQQPALGEEDVAAAHLLPLSASSSEALRAVIERYERWLSSPGAGEYDWAEIAATAAIGRDHFRHRVALVATNREEALASLRSLSIAAYPGTASISPSLCFLFTGQGSEHSGMGFDLLKHSAVFRAAVERLDRALDGGLPRSIAEIWANEHGELEQASLVQPALYAYGWALSEFWRSCGVEPQVVLGHSLGEYVAATVAGVMTPEEGIRLVAVRGRLTQDLGAAGGMVAIVAGEEQVRTMLATSRFHDDLSVAAVNGRLSVVVSGGREAIQSFEQNLRETGLRHKRLRTTHGFHSAALDGMLDAFEAEAATVPFRVPDIRWISNLTGHAVDRKRPTDARYWRQHLRQTVEFQRGLSAARLSGAGLFLEVGPEPQLLALAEADGIAPDQCVPSISKRGAAGEWTKLLSAVGQLYTQGVDIDWTGLNEGRRFRRAPLPTYPFQRQRFWFTQRGRESVSAGASAKPAGHFPAQHPLLGARLRSHSEATTFHAELTPLYPADLGDHIVLGRRMLPGAAYLEMALAAARQVDGQPHWKAADVEFREPCFFDEPRLLETVVSAVDAASGRRQFEIASTALQAQGGQPGETAAENENWTVHAVGTLEHASSSDAGSPVDLVAIQSVAKSVLDQDAFYKRFKAAGLDFGPAFQAVGQAWGVDDEGLVALDLAPEVIAESANYAVHPIALDACLQAAAVLIHADASASPALPAALSSFHCLGNPSLLQFAHVKVRKRDGSRLSMDIAGLDAAGKCLFLAEGLRLMPSSGQQYRGWLHQVEWEPIALSQGSSGEQSDSLPWAPVSLDSDLLQTELKIAAQQTGLAEFETWMRDFDSLCSAWIAESFEQGGFDVTPGREFSSHDLLRQLFVAPQHHRLAHRFLAILCESGSLESRGPDCFRVLKRTPLDIASGAARLRAANHPEMDWTEQTVAQLLPLLRGKVSPLNVLFSEAGRQIATRLYRGSVVARTLNPVVANAAVQAAVQLDRKVRVLEVGGGTAATTSHLLPALRGRVQEYVWTDLGGAFVSAARREFASIGGMRFQTLDVERKPEEQGLAGELFDIVIASNVIHATADLKQTLGHIRSLLAPGGVLLMVETTSKQPWIDLTVGFTEGWWRFSDRNLRPDYALIGKQSWVSLLSESGFGDVLLVPDQQDGVLSGQCVIAAVNGAQKGHAAPANPARTAGASVLIITAGSVAEPGPLASSLVQEAKSNGAVITLISASEIDQAAVDAWFVEPLNSRDVSSSYRHIFYLPAAELTTSSADITGIDALSWQMEVLGGALACTQALLSGDHFSGCRLWLVSRGAFGPEISSPDGASIAAFARSLCGEYLEARATAVDLPANEDSAQQLWRLAREIPDTTVQVALRGDRVWVPRLAPYILPQNGAEKMSGAALGQSETRRLRFAPSGLLEDLEPGMEDRRAPASDEVEIAIGATAINFHEVLSALEPGSTHDVAPGGECAGVVVRVGDRVSGMQAGDRVVAIGSGLMADFATLHCDRVWKMPDGMSEEDAATLLIPFLTARWCLDRVARLRAGERVLIHAGAGGVGLAAIQEAKRLGALVYATAGSDAKREYLRSVGVEDVFDSRSTSFESSVFAATGFRGVDVVLNSLSGDKIAAGLRSLAPRGRFIELGEHSVLSDSEAQALRPDVSYHRVHLRAALQAASPEVRDMIASILDDVAAGRICPLPWKRFALNDAAAGFRYMAAGQHTGRVLLAPSSSTARFTIRSDGAYVVTGGFSGLGRLTVEWLARRGAGCVLVLARSQADAETGQLFAQLQQKGTAIIAVRCDVSDEAALTAAVDAIPAAYALRGVFHAAGVLDDGSLPQQTATRFSAVLAPKVAGGWNLHRLTSSAKLDCFVLFSSAAGLLGSRGQSNHAAANAYLDALARYRREHLGLHALSVNWGAWSGTGAAVRHNVVERGERIGVDSIPPADGFRILERLLEENCTQVLVSRVDWARWAEHGKAEAVVNADLLTRVLHGPKHSSAQQNGSAAGSHQSVTVIAPDGHRSWRSALLSAPQAQQLPMLEAHVEERVRAVLCLNASQAIAATRPLQEYGLDSLLSIELRNALSSDLEAKLAATTLFDYPTLASLTNYLFRDVLDIRTNEDAAQNGQTPKQDVIGAVASLSDDEVERLFQGKMAGIQE